MAKVKFAAPSCIRHEEAKRFVRDMVKYLNDMDAIGPKDIPCLHRMATSFDMYLTAREWLTENDPIVINKKGEPVKHPYWNIEREAWNQFAMMADKYGLTIKSRSQINAHRPQEKKENTPMDEYFASKIQR